MKKKLLLLPQIYFFVLLLLTLVLHYFYPGRQIIHYPYTYVGVLFIVIGTALGLKSAKIFRKNRVPREPKEATKSFITSGTFSILNRPTYLGMTLILIGTAIYLGTLSALIPPVIFIIISGFFLTPQKEKSMESKFEEK